MSKPRPDLINDAQRIFEYIYSLCKSNPEIKKVFLIGSRSKKDWSELKEKDWDFAFVTSKPCNFSAKGRNEGYHIDIICATKEHRIRHKSKIEIYPKLCVHQNTIDTYLRKFANSKS